MTSSDVNISACTYVKRLALTGEVHYTVDM